MLDASRTARVTASVTIDGVGSAPKPVSIFPFFNTSIMDDTPPWRPNAPSYIPRDSTELNKAYNYFVVNEAKFIRITKAIQGNLNAEFGPLPLDNGARITFITAPKANVIGDAGFVAATVTHFFILDKTKKYNFANVLHGESPYGVGLVSPNLTKMDFRDLSQVVEHEKVHISQIAKSSLDQPSPLLGFSEMDLVYDFLNTNLFPKPLQDRTDQLGEYVSAAYTFISEFREIEAASYELQVLSGTNRMNRTAANYLSKRLVNLGRLLRDGVPLRAPFSNSHGNTPSVTFRDTVLLPAMAKAYDNLPGDYDDLKLKPDVSLADPKFERKMPVETDTLIIKFKP